VRGVSSPSRFIARSAGVVDASLGTGQLIWWRSAPRNGSDWGCEFSRVKAAATVVAEPHLASKPAPDLIRSVTHAVRIRSHSSRQPGRSALPARTPQRETEIDWR
jgi:hypothetical protein